MRESILGAEVTAALNFLAQVDGARTRLGVVTFAEAYETASSTGTANALVVQPLTFDQRAVRSALAGPRPGVRTGARTWRRASDWPFGSS